MNKIKIASAFIAVILIFPAAAAKNFTRHEFSVNMGGGVSGFQTRPTIGNDHWKPTCTIGLGYHYLFHPNLGIGTGADIVAYNGRMSIKDYNQRQDAVNKVSG